MTDSPTLAAGLGAVCLEAGLAVRAGLARAYPGAPGPVNLAGLADAGVTASTVRACRLEMDRYRVQLSEIPGARSATERALTRGLCLTLRTVTGGVLTAGQVEWLAAIGATPGGFSVMAQHLTGGTRAYHSHASSVRRARAAAGFAPVLRVLPADTYGGETGQETEHALAWLPEFDWASGHLALAAQMDLADLPGTVLDQAGAYWTTWARCATQEAAQDPDWDGYEDDDVDEDALFRAWHRRNAAALGVRAALPWGVPDGQRPAGEVEQADAEGLVVLALLPWFAAGYAPEEAAAALALPNGHPGRLGDADLAVMAALLRSGG